MGHLRWSHKGRSLAFLFIALVFLYAAFWVYVRNFSVISVGHVQYNDGTISAVLKLRSERSNAKIFCETTGSGGASSDAEYGWHTSGYAVGDSGIKEWIYNYKNVQKIEIVANELPVGIDSLSCYIRQADYNFFIPFTNVFLVKFK